MNFRLLFLLFLTGCLSAQNLVPNGSFESYTNCPTSYSQLCNAAPWMNPSSGYPQSSTGTPDFYNSCATQSTYVSVPHNLTTYQPAYSGNGYAGIYLILTADYKVNCREYIEAPLTLPLASNSRYHFSMRINLGNISNYSTDAIGVYFSDTAVVNIPNYAPLPFNPQITNSTNNFIDTVNWTLVSGDYVAHGGEKFIIIGNFKNDSNTQTVTVNGNLHSDFAYCLIDDVSLYNTSTRIDETQLTYNLTVYPNPLNNDKLFISVENNVTSRIRVFDQYSTEIVNQVFYNNLTIDFSKAVKGFYFYEITDFNSVIRRGKLVRQ